MMYNICKIILIFLVHLLESKLIGENTYYKVVKDDNFVWYHANEAEYFQTSKLSNDKKVTELFENIQFVFNSHWIFSIFVATSGFVSTGEHLHKKMTMTQYIAPLKAHFDFNATDISNIFYFRNQNDDLCITWSRVNLEYSDDLLESTNESFSFQLVIDEKKGILQFNYLEIPKEVKEIEKDSHEVVAGLSDGYHENLRGKSYIHIYSELKMNLEEIHSKTSIRFVPNVNFCAFKQTRRDCKSLSMYCHWCYYRKLCYNESSLFEQESQFLHEERCNHPPKNHGILLRIILPLLIGLLLIASFTNGNEIKRT
ncbi:hypothetical protein SNEBB_004726 [Seison nebaliae]|nr:hypothetical protein SNEBB_004726 [Seison nebaliae]